MILLFQKRLCDGVSALRNPVSRYVTGPRALASIQSFFGPSVSFCTLRDSLATKRLADTDAAVPSTTRSTGTPIASARLGTKPQTARSTAAASGHRRVEIQPVRELEEWDLRERGRRRRNRREPLEGDRDEQGDRDERSRERGHERSRRPSLKPEHEREQEQRHEREQVPLGEVSDVARCEDADLDDEPRRERDRRREVRANVRVVLASLDGAPREHEQRAERDDPADQHEIAEVVERRSARLRPRCSPTRPRPGSRRGPS